MARGKDISTTEVDIIKNNYMNMTDKELSILLHRPIGSVTRKRQRLGLFYVQQVLEGSIKGELWRSFHTESGHYQISDKGRVKCGSKLMSVYLNHRGYFILRVSNYKGTSASYKVHRLVADAFIVKPPQWAADWHVHHIDFNSRNNSKENLMWLSPKDHYELHRNTKLN